jgi:FKBP-type peptidyl-prolyl cis-trans isomerase
MMKTFAFTFILCATLPCLAQKKMTQNDSIAYAVFYNTAMQLNSTNTTYKSAIVQQAIADAAKKKPAVNLEKCFNTYRQIIDKSKTMENQTKYAANVTEGVDFMKKNGTRPEVKTLANGIQYEIITEGTGESPAVKDDITVHYAGTLINGTEFDSSYKRNQPITFPLGNLIKGWQEVIPFMKKGAKYKMVLPYNYAYGERGAGAGIPPYATLIFEVELLDFVKK